MMRGILSRDGLVRLAVMAAFADVAIVVLALPDLIDQMDTSVSTVSWVIIGYSLALVLTALFVAASSRRLEPRSLLVAGLALFGLASLGCGVAQSIDLLIAMRCIQGVGGGLLLCGSLSTQGEADPTATARWATVVAIGLAAGPCLGGLLTGVFDWRSIFLVQVLVVGGALASVLKAGSGQVESASTRVSPVAPSSASPDAPWSGRIRIHAGLALLSAALTCALFLVVLVLIDVWGNAPIAAAAIVTMLPLATVGGGRVGQTLSPAAQGTIGAAAVAGGLLLLSFITHEQLGLVALGLALVGTGMGLALPALMSGTLRGGGSAIVRVARTVAAHDAGIVLGLLILTPILVGQMDTASKQAVPAAGRAVLDAPLPATVKFSLVPGLLADYETSPSGRLPDFGPTFAQAELLSSDSEQADLVGLHEELDSLVGRAATGAFRLPFRYGACLAALAAALLLTGAWRAQSFRGVLAS